MVIIGLTLIGLIAVLFVFARFSLHRGFAFVEKDLVSRFEEVENNDARKNVQRVVDALDATIDNISTKLADWAQWDDTYRYVEDLNKQYSKSNLNEQSLAALKLNFMAIIHSSGRIVFSFAYDLEAGKKINVPEDLFDHLKKNDLLLSHRDPQGLVAGIVLLKQGPMMVASRPIVTSDYKGPIHGVVIFGQFLNDIALKRLADLTHLKIETQFYNTQSAAADFKEARSKIGEKTPIYIRCAGSDTISGYATISDIYQKPVLLAKVNIPREIFQQGQRTLREVRDQGRVTLITLVSGVSAAGVVLGIVILLVLEVLVLARLGRLSFSSYSIGTSKDFTARVSVEGKDELAKLGLSINGMLESLSQTHSEIEKYNAEIRLLMNSVPVGLLALNEEFRINPQYSRSSETILGRLGLSGLDYFEVLGLSKDGPVAEDRAKLHEFLDVFQKEMLPEKDCAMLNPFETFQLTINDSARWLKLRYYLIRRGAGECNHLLVVIEDITRAHELEMEVIRSQQENLQLKAIVEDPDLFREFISESLALLAHTRAVAARLTTGEESRALVNEIFRNVHTIKGVAGAFALTKVTQTAGTIEDSLLPLRQKGEISRERIEQTHADLSRLAKVFDEVKKDAKNIIGEEIGEEPGMYLRVSLDDLKRHISEIRALAIDNDLKNKKAMTIKDEIIRRLASMKMVPAGKGFARATKIVPDLIKRLGKNAVFSFEGQETPIDCEVAHELTTALVHLIRNAFDHGLESIEERIEAGKPEQGEVKLSARSENNHVVLEIVDDGKGIDPEELKAIAIAKNILSPEEAGKLSLNQCYDLIFRPGFSTKTEVTEISGRGVGLDAVAHAVKKKLKGEITIDSTIGKGSRFIIRVPATPLDLTGSRPAA